ncbi:NADH-quinone oxidoreductase subunit I [Anaeroselena agilis]|uniref:4Fe-4S binding protein n=1 Tax=Anaeroselena agilis TaxID=3063788 RepID=A0ABU3P083_9FIRM|nr:4Fe-4S binding protein [Selenomonadales bacterium 4137-cl]
MSAKLATCGYLSADELAACLPASERMAKGPVAVIECVQDIPCNPCEQACPVHAITVGVPITSLPVLDAAKCIGCGVCIARCPGLAIFVIDGSRPGGEGTVQLPYEAWPLPQPGDAVVALDRRGQRVGDGTVEKVLNATAQDHTAVVTVRVPKELLNTVRAISVEGRAQS